MSHTRNSNEGIPQEDNYTFPQHICCPVVVAGNDAEVSRVQEVIQEEKEKKKSGGVSVEHATLYNPQPDAPMSSGVKEPLVENMEQGNLQKIKQLLAIFSSCKHLNMFPAVAASTCHPIYSVNCKWS